MPPLGHCIRAIVAALGILLAYVPVATAGDVLKFELKMGDRVLFLGNGFVENDQGHAYLETRLQRRYPGQAISFRYMGWSGDTVLGSARTAGFQVPQGLARLEKESLALKPTVIFLAYGMNESFAGPQVIADFLRDYDQLLKTLAPLKARLVILSPTYHEDLGRPFPDPSEHNQHLEQYTKALKKFADQRKLAFVDLFHPPATAKKADGELRLTTNGILLTQAGYALAGQAAEQQLGFGLNYWEVTLDGPGKAASVSSAIAKIVTIEVKGNTVRLQTNDARLPLAPEVHILRITGLQPGNHLLKIDGQEILHASAADWNKGVRIAKGPMFADAEKLREAIVHRNQLFYRRWRPYNDHSRHWGFIGGDFKLYDQEIAAQENRIAELSAVRTRTYEITRAEPPK
ncbi:MAG: hypothetical protein EXR98_06900 [Gemmataceae bacterium]|nr:hypothetical protein [Gemmataceae bacterium]